MSSPPWIKTVILQVADQCSCMTGTASFKAVNQVEWSNLQKWFKAAWTQSWVCSSECRTDQVAINKVISCHFWFLSYNTIWVWSHLFPEELTASRADGQSAGCGSEITSTSSLWCSNVIDRGMHRSEQQDKKWVSGAPEDLLGVTCIWNSVILILP